MPAYNSEEVVVPAYKTQNNQAGRVKITWDAQSLSSSNTHITATLKAIGSDVLIKKLDINNGIGNDYKGVQLVNVPYASNSEGANSTLEVRVIAVIPDKNFNVRTNGQYEHRFFYMPITGPDGKIWLNNNLGAEYANIDSQHFNPAQQGTSARDWKSYGSLFQWGRPADGHELINWSSSTSGTEKHDLGWNGTKNYVNPCPTGYHIPTKDELIALYYAITGTHNLKIDNSTVWDEASMRLPASGWRHFFGGKRHIPKKAGLMILIWSTEPGPWNQPPSHVTLEAEPRKASVDKTSTRAAGGVRCLQD